MSTRDEVIASLTAPGAPFEIRTEQVNGESMQVFARRHRSLRDLLEASAVFRDAEYLVTRERRISFSEHLGEVAALAHALREEHGVGPGDRVALCATNSPEWIVGFWATVSLGAVAVGMNSMWAAPEVAHGIALTEPRVVIADAPRRRLIGAEGAGFAVLSVEDDVPAAVARYAGRPLPALEQAPDEDAPAVILFTSGTSGRPKGATHSHRNVLSACWTHLYNDAVAAGTGHPQSGRRFLLATPLFHIAALHNLAVVRLAVGDTAVIHLGRFDIGEVLGLVEAEQVTNWGAVPTMLSRVVELGDGVASYDLSSLRTVSVSSAPSSPQLKAALRRVLPVAGRSLGTSYGLTESSTAVTLAGPVELVADPETVGRPVPTVEVEVRDPAGVRVPDGAEGEICIRGPQVFLGYWNRSTDGVAGPVPLPAGGWFSTGDLGVWKDGHLSIASRRSDLILRGGENIYPAEVEHQILRHPAVLECIVVGVEDSDLGQAVAAHVVLRPGAGVSTDDLVAHTAEGIARYKVPTRWNVSGEPLPRNATGKVNRRELRPVGDPDRGQSR